MKELISIHTDKIKNNNMPKKGLYGVYKPLQPNQRQGDEIITNYMDRQEKKRQLDLQEKSMAPKRREVKYTADILTDVPENFTTIAGTLKEQQAKYAVQIQDSDKPFAEKAANNARLESSADGLQSIFTSYAELVKDLEDPEVIDTLDSAAAERLLDQTLTITQGEFDVDIDPVTYKVSIIDRNGKEWSLHDKGRELQEMKADIAGAKSQYGKTKKLREGAGFYGKADAQWADGRRKLFTDPNVHTAYESTFVNNWGPIVEPEEEARAEREGRKIYGKTRAEAEKIMEDQYKTDFQMADPTPPAPKPEVVKPEKSIWDYRISEGEMISYDSGNGGLYAPKPSEGAKSQDLQVQFTDPKFGVAVEASPQHIAYDRNGNITGVRVKIAPTDAVVDAYMNTKGWNEAQAMEYITEEVRFIPTSKKGLMNYLVNNPEEAFPSAIQEARKIANGSGSEADKGKQLYDLYVSQGNSEENLNRTYLKNKATINSQFKYTIDSMKKVNRTSSTKGILD